MIGRNSDDVSHRGNLSPWRRPERIDGSLHGRFSPVQDSGYGVKFEQSRRTSSPHLGHNHGTVVAMAQCSGDERSDPNHLRFAHSLGCHRRRTDADPGGDERGAGIVGDRVPVQRDPGLVENELGLLPGQVGIEGPKIDQEEVGVGATADQAEALLDKRLGQSLGVGDDLGGVDPELGVSASPNATALAAMLCS